MVFRLNGAGDRTPALAARLREPAIHHDPVLIDGQLEREAAGVGLLAHRHGRRAPGVGDRQEPAGVHALIAAVRRIGERLAARVVVGEHGGE